MSNDNWEIADAAKVAGTPVYTDEPGYAELASAVGKIRGNYIAHGFNNCLYAHKFMHELLQSIGKVPQPAPKCPTCGGTGFERSKSDPEPLDRKCPRCHDTGHAGKEQG